MGLITVSHAETELLMDVAASQMTGFPAAVCCEAGSAAGGASGASVGAVAAAACACDGTLTPRDVVADDVFVVDAAPEAAGSNDVAVAERRGAAWGYVQPCRMVWWGRWQMIHFAGVGQFLAIWEFG